MKFRSDESLSYVSDVLTEFLPSFAVPTQANRVCSYDRKFCLERQESNQCIVLTKPELLLHAQRRQVRRIVETLLNSFQNNALKVMGVSLISSAELHQNAIVDSCYERLNLVSRNGIYECSKVHRAKIQRISASLKIPIERVLGGDQVLSHFAQLSRVKLKNSIDKIGCEKIGAGIYATPMAIEKVNYLVLNGFYPYQRSWLQQPNSIVIAFSLVTEKSWKFVRANLIGDICPQNAAVSSLRGELYSRRKKFGIKKMDIAHNGIHFSANPFDAMYYHKALFGINPATTIFGSLLRERGFDLRAVRRTYYAKDLTHNGRRIDVRDIAEDKTNLECLHVLKNLLVKRD